MDRRAALLLVLVALSASEPISLKYFPHNEDRNDTLIWYNVSMYHSWSHQLDNLVEVYSSPKHTEGRKENLVNCSYAKPTPPGKVCRTSVHHFKPCTSQNHFGYKTGTPCIFLQLEKTEGWKQKPFNSSKSLRKNTPHSLPESMPKNLQRYINSVTQINPKSWQSIWVSCEGETPSDMEFIGPIDYLPVQEIPSFMFSGSDSKGYLPPIVAVHLESPVRGVVINIECKAWIPNTGNESKSDVVSTHFQILIDD